MDNSWMRVHNRLSKEYREGVEAFIEVQKQNGKDKCKCPCRDCQETCLLDLATIGKHLVVRGLSSTFVARSTANTNPSEDVESEEEEDDVIGMLDDAFGLHEQTENAEFHKLFSGLDEELYPGSKKLSSFQFLVKLMHLKVLNRWSNKSFNMLVQLLKDALPDGSSIPASHYDAKKKMRDFGLGYESIHVCKYDCALFWKEHQNADKCPECNEPRYKYDNVKGKNIPHKVLRYFPLKPRLQRLFMSRHTAGDMRWHKEKRVDTEGVLRHPADALAWKDFDRQYPWFAQDPRNVRLGLASDGFNPFGNMSNSYSMWPVILMPYNMPPWKCMKEHFFMMTLLIPGPQSPGKDMDIFLRPVVDELKELWETGVQTWDAHGEENFSLHAAVLWTINDFPAYGSLSGWSTKGYKACPVCNEDSSSEPLRSKICYIGHRRYLPLTHPWRRSKLHNGKHELRPPPREFSGDDILQQLNCVIKSKPGKNPNNVDRKRKRTTEELNWSKKSIFFELEYWSKLKLRHNLDVMHIEKNITDNVIGTLMSIEGKNKDTDKARLDLADMNIRKELHLKEQGNKWLKPRASYTLTPSERKEFCSFLKSVKFPDGYAANISRNVNITDGKISGMKTHDCHVMLQRLLPVGIRPYLPKDVCSALIELSNFFQQLCSKVLVVQDLEKLEEGIVLILCKLERIFPPAFFDVMVHLAVHLPREAILGGPVNTRWMFPIERNLGTLKGSVKQKARPEGSIAETYVVNEALTFCSMYLHGIETRFNREDRNKDTRKDGVKGQISVFSQIASPFGGREYVELPRKDIDKIHWYILHNCEEIKPYLDEHMIQLERESSHNLYQRQEQEFPKWFSNHIRKLRSAQTQGVPNEIYSLACGPDERVNKYTGCVVNGVRFHTKERDNHHTTQNNGVVVPGDYDDETIDFYGRLCSVIELNYIMGYRVIIFECEWFDTNPKKKRIQRDYHLTSVNDSIAWFKNDPYVLATQVSQVFYLDDYKAGSNWKVVNKVIHRHIWDVLEKEINEVNGEAYQEAESSDVQCVVEAENLDAIQLVRADEDSDEEINPAAFDFNNEDDGVFEEEEDDTFLEYYSEGEESQESYDDDSD